MENLRLHNMVRFIGGWRMELADVARGIVLQHQSDLFEQLPLQRAQWRFVSLDLSAGLHEPRRTGLADQQQPACFIVYQGSGDADR